MKKRSAAVLLIVFLLALTGCRIAPAGETGGPPPPEPPAATPLASASPTPAPTPEPAEPVSSAPLEPTGGAEEIPVIVTGGGAGMSAEERYQYALAWIEEHRQEFHHAGLYAMDRGYWFADWTQGVTEIPYGEGSAYFYEDTAGNMTPAQVVDAMFGQTGACFEAREPEDWTAAKERLAGRAAQEAAGDREAVSRFLAGELAARPELYPGIGEEMWLCGAETQIGQPPGWYVLMKQGNVYRLQWDPAFGTYVRTPEIQVRLAFDAALEAYKWFHGAPLSYDGERAAVSPDPEGGTWYAVSDQRISSLLELRTHLKTLFSDEIVDRLMSAGIYQELDGVLHVLPSHTEDASPAGLTSAVLRESETKLVYRLEEARASGEPSLEPAAVLDLPYERVGDKWVFTEFSWPW